MMKKLFVFLCCLSALATSARAQQTITAGGVSFLLADEFEVSGREQLSDGEALMISPKVNPDNDRLVLRIYPDALAGIDGLTSEEVSDMLKNAVDALAGVIAKPEKKSGFKLDGAYRIHFEDDPHCPQAYTSFSGTDKRGQPFFLHAEATLVSGFLVSGCAIAMGKGPLDDLVAVYQEAVVGAADSGEEPDNGVSTRPVTAAGITFNLDEDFRITQSSEETFLVVPDDGSEGQLYLVLLPDILEGANPSHEQVSKLLTDSTRKLADAVAGTFGLSKDYRIRTDLDGLFPITYTTFSGKDKDGYTFTCHAETSLMDGSVVAGCAVAYDEPMLDRLTGIYREAVLGAMK